MFDEMISVAEKLSEGIRAVRVDLYLVAGKIYFGEYTFYHEAGFTPFIPDEWNATFGSWLDIKKIIIFEVKNVYCDRMILMYVWNMWRNFKKNKY